MQLIQGMYADFTCNLFSLRYNQQRSDEVIRNANWYNARGEKIGQGDLNFNDLFNIFKLIGKNEIFFVLSEGDGNWNLPDGVDRFAPGILYMMENARWVITSAHGVLAAFKICNNPKQEERYMTQYVPEHDQNYCYFDYREMSRNKIKEYLGYTSYGKLTSIKDTATLVAIHPGAFYGLDVYHLSDGKSWAIDHGYEDRNVAARLKAKENLWKIPRSYFSGLTSIELTVIDSLLLTHGKDSNDFIAKILDSKTDRIVEDYIADVGPHRILDPSYTSSTNIDGLPDNRLAYRIEQNDGTGDPLF